MPEQRNQAALSQLRRSQRILLFGGGVVTTVMLLLALVIDGISEVRDFVANERYAYSVGKSLVDARIELSETFVRMGVVSSELAWKGNDRSNRALVDRFYENDRQLLIQPASNMRAHLVIGVPGDPFDPEYMTRYLALSAQSARLSVANALARGRTIEGYFYSIDKNLVTVIPAPSRTNERAAAALLDTRRLIETLRIDLSDLKQSEESELISTRRTVRWLPPFSDPISGRELVRIAAPAFDGQKPFVVVVGEIERNELLTPLGKH